METTEDEQILSLLRDPQERGKAFKMMVARFSEPLYWKIRGIVLTHEDADDVLQNTFMKAWRGLDSFRGEAQLSTWLYRIAINEALDFLRQQRRNRLLSTEDVPTVANQLMADPYFNGDQGQALLREAVATLPEVQRTVFTLRYFDEMHYAEMSQLLHTTEGGLKASYHIAVKKITEYLKKHV